MTKEQKEMIKYCLFNETGAAGLEELIGIAVGMVAGAGVYVVANTIRKQIRKNSQNLGEYNNTLGT